MVKGIDNAFDQMELCLSSINGRLSSVKIGLFFQEITFITEFRVANLLLATVNFEPWCGGI